jgi:hypothetical protein
MAQYVVYGGPADHVISRIDWATHDPEVNEFGDLCLYQRVPPDSRDTHPHLAAVFSRDHWTRMVMDFGGDQ